MEKTVEHCNISVDEHDFKLVLVFLCKHIEERDRERQRKRKRERDKERDKNKNKVTETERIRKRKAGEEKQGRMISLSENLCAYIKSLGSLCW